MPVVFVHVDTIWEVIVCFVSLLIGGALGIFLAQVFRAIADMDCFKG